MAESTISPQSGTKNWATGVIEKFFAFSGGPKPVSINAVKKYSPLSATLNEQFHEKS
jgi:hypothetical protein